MKVHYGYFREPSKQQEKKQKFAEYTKEQDKRCKESNEPYVQASTSWLIKTPFGYFRVGGRNTKVHFPTLNFESGLSCSSQGSCPYSYGVKRKNKTGKPLCYAQKLEGNRPGMFDAKQYHALVSERIAKKATPAQVKEIVKNITEVTKFLANDKYVRLSEVGDIGPTVLPFAVEVIKSLTAAGLKPYLYTKQPKDVQDKLKAAGAVIVVSDELFVCVKNEEEAKQKNLVVCPGQCGGPKGCYRCPLGKKSAVIAH